MTTITKAPTINSNVKTNTFHKTVVFFAFSMLALLLPLLVFCTLMVGVLPDMAERSAPVSASSSGWLLRLSISNFYSVSGRGLQVVRFIRMDGPLARRWKDLFVDDDDDDDIMMDQERLMLLDWMDEEKERWMLFDFLYKYHGISLERMVMRFRLVCWERGARAMDLNLNFRLLVDRKQMWRPESCLSHRYLNRARLRLMDIFSRTEWSIRCLLNMASCLSVWQSPEWEIGAITVTSAAEPFLSNKRMRDVY